LIAELQLAVLALQEYLWLGFAVFLRASALVALVPGFGEQVIPIRVRLGMAISFTLIVVPVLSPLNSPDGFVGWIMIMAPEVVVGAFFGMALRLFVLVLQICGSIAAQSTSLSQIFGGSAGVDPQPAIGRVLVVAGLALACSIGLHAHIASYILQSYTIVPFGVLIASERVLAVGLLEISKAFSLGFTLAAPFVVASLIYNVTLGVINRAMPQLMVSFVGAPAITAGGLFLLFVTSPLLLDIWLNTLVEFMKNPFGGF